MAIRGGQGESLLAVTTGQPEVRERVDAARNRARVLAAAEQVFAAKDARQVTMEDIARAAGVGRATLYRRYPDPASIAAALLDEHERQLQEQLLRGEPPLGPGATPSDRLAAFYGAMTALLDRHLHLVLGAEVGDARFGTGAYGFWRMHVRALLVEAGVREPDGLIEVLLAPLAPEVYQEQRRRGVTQEQVADSLTWLSRRLLTP
ncbi:TetR/AcrR family transcriptional regulator [Nocardia sp. NRRL S-836]|uniref:TetR/AcrR family transcriptional regulator n=1 Tax=Nocardia sp. NRRL S-836 TaxID=1519492 RepID=UPI0006AF8ECD|nr:TetR/AcrR family transcriptional regulator [Nocardia sp. NRRL S-836]KOV84128.1 transcriptional regulator [Nocardia sp. NRRL S-836]